MTRFLSFIRRVYQGYTQNGGALRAAAISYYALVSVIPLLLLAVGMFGLALRSQTAGYQETLHLIRAVVGWNTAYIETVLQDIIKSSGAIGAVGLIVLLWTGSNVFHVLEDALNRTWKIAQNRPYWQGRLVAFGVLATGGIALLAGLVVTLVIQWVRAHPLLPLGRSLPHLALIWGLSGYLTLLIAAIVIFTIIYRVIPYAPVTWKEALVGGLFAGSLWELSKVVFGYYVTLFGNRATGRLYGSLGGLALVVIWVYYTANILVLGGEVAHAWAEFTTPPVVKKRRSRRPVPTSRPRPRSRFRMKAPPPPDRHTAPKPSGSEKRSAGRPGGVKYESPPPTVDNRSRKQRRDEEVSRR
jgi:membrane protein